MQQQPKILLIDKTADRKKRISVLKQNGYAVYPALKIAEANSRCKPGRYDLVIVTAGDEQQAALEFCDELVARDARQQVLLATPDGESWGRKYAVSAQPDQLLEKVRQLFKKTGEVEYALAA